MKKLFKILILILFILTGTQGCSDKNIKNEEKTISTDEIRWDTLIITGQNNDLSLVNGTLLYRGEPFSGEIITLFENGDTSSAISYLSGKEHGISEKWYSSGQKMEERYFINGRKEGTHKAWYEDGKERFIYNFKNGEYEGELKEWYPNGQMYKDFNYVDGYESGMQTAWETNGKLLANYDVKNGRKYGLIGTHNCKSLWDDVTEGENNEGSM